MADGRTAPMAAARTANVHAQDRAELERLRERLALSPAERLARFAAGMRTLHGLYGIARTHQPHAPH